MCCLIALIKIFQQNEKETIDSMYNFHIRAFKQQNGTDVNSRDMNNGLSGIESSVGDTSSNGDRSDRQVGEATNVGII